MKVLIAGTVLMIGMASCARAEPSELVGRWRVVAKLSPVEQRVLQFEARPGGKGSFLLLDPASSLSEPQEPTSAWWEAVAVDRVTFWGDVAFPIGNVGRDPGTLVFKGTLESAGTIAGSVDFFKLGQDPKLPGAVPARSGSFTARRVKN